MEQVKARVRAEVPRGRFPRVHFMVPVFAGLALHWLSVQIGCPLDKYLPNPLPFKLPEEAPSVPLDPLKERVVIVASEKQVQELQDQLKASSPPHPAGAPLPPRTSSTDCNAPRGRVPCVSSGSGAGEEGRLRGPATPRSGPPPRPP